MRKYLLKNTANEIGKNEKISIADFQKRIRMKILSMPILKTQTILNGFETLKFKGQK